VEPGPKSTLDLLSAPMFGHIGRFHTFRIPHLQYPPNGSWPKDQGVIQPIRPRERRQGQNNASGADGHGRCQGKPTSSQVERSGDVNSSFSEQSESRRRLSSNRREVGEIK
jgi:hypothetical protein